MPKSQKQKVDAIVWDAGIGPTINPLDRRDDCLAVKSATELLMPHRALMIQLKELAGVSDAVYQVFYQAAIEAFARYVQQLPASEVHHHADLGGLLAHTLEVCVFALKLRRSYLLSSQGGAEEIAKKQDLWTYAVFLGALCHDIGKPAVDQRVEIYSGITAEPVLWDPFGHTMDEQGRYYRYHFVHNRVYRFHEKVTPLLVSRIIPTPGMQWLSSEVEILTQWVAAITGDLENADALGAMVSQADSQSVAKNLGAGNQPVSTVKTKALHEKMLTALRHLLANGELPLNRNGAAAWITGSECWFVSKRTLDAIRGQLVQEGHSGIPTQNSRLLDVLQEQGILIPCGDKAIWRATISGDGWQNSLTVLRMPVSRLWPNPESKPDVFTGEVIPDRDPAQEDGKEDSIKDGQIFDQRGHQAISESKQRNDNHLTTSVMADSPLSDYLPSMMLPPLPATTQDESDAGTAIGSGQCLEKERLLSGSVKLLKMPASPFNNQRVTRQTDQFSESSDDPHDLADVVDAFMVWLHAGIHSRAIAVNEPHALIHRVVEGVLLVTPGIFKRYAKEYDLEDWLLIQKRLLKKHWHQKDEKGLNVYKYQVVGKQKRSTVNGLLFPDAAFIFGPSPVPKSNPHLVPGSSHE